MSQRSELVAKAVSQIGYKEGPSNATIYGKWYGMDNNPWCMMFISWCAAQCNIDKQIIPKLAYVPYAVEHYKNQRRYYAKRSYTPKPGDIVFFGNSSHVGICEKAEGGKLYTIEGNTSATGNSSNGDGVYRRERKLTDAWIMGYGVPNYQEEEEVEIKTVKVKSLDTGSYIEVEAVNVEGVNYIKLRDIEKLVPVKIDWDGKNPTMNLAYK
jgi:hypothetical protein